VAFGHGEILVSNGRGGAEVRLEANLGAPFIVGFYVPGAVGENINAVLQGDELWLPKTFQASHFSGFYWTRLGRGQSFA
jgi:hypothetical protein